MSDRVLYVSQLTYYPATYGTKAWRQIDLQRAAAGFRLSKLGLARGFEMSEFVVDDYFPIYFGAQTTRSTQPVRPTTYRTAGKRNAHVRKSSFYNPLSHHRNFLLQTEPRRTHQARAPSRCFMFLGRLKAASIWKRLVWSHSGAYRSHGNTHGPVA